MAEAENNNKKQPRKRTRNPSEWKREKRKRLRIAGKAYVNSKGDVVDERKIGEDCKCRRKCYNRVPEDQRNKLFDGYYSLNSHDEQNAYLFGLIRKHDIARKRCKESDRRTCSYKYYVRIRGKEVQICRLAFAHIHGISPHKIRILCRKQDQNIMYPRDGRGKHNNRPRKIPVDTLRQIKDHIYSIVSSDRVQHFLKDEKHVGPDVNITKMWKDYLEKYDPNYKDMLYSDETGLSKDLNITGLESDSDLLPNFSETGYRDLSDTSHSQTYSTTIDLSEYPISAVADGLGLIEHSTSYDSEINEEVSSSQNKGKHPGPIVKHWLYSKVFHEEFKVQDFISLKKKLWHLKDSTKIPVNQQGNKSERKQRSPKKISREKDMCADLDVAGNSVLNSNQSVIEFPASQFHTLNTTQNTDMYILPLNIQDLSHLSQPNDISSQTQHAMQLNLHTFPTQNNVLSPLVNVNGSSQGIQCSSVVNLPTGSMSLSQNSCGYMNFNMAAFY